MGRQKPFPDRHLTRKRKAHRKSRTGCRNCKLRRVKCDEDRPSCHNCMGMLLKCNYDPLSSSPQAPSSSSSTTLREDDLNFSLSETNLAHVAIVTDLNTMVASQYPQTWDLKSFRAMTTHDIDRLNRWHNRTVFTMGPRIMSLRYQLIASQGVTRYPYLLHAVLAMAAMHEEILQLPASSTRQKRYHEAYYYHNSCAAALFNKRLSKPPFNKAADRNAVWTTAAILGNMASFATETYNPELAWPISSSSTASLDWMDMHKGLSTIYRLFSPSEPGGMFHDIIEDPRYSLLKYKWIEDRRGGTEGIPPQFVALCGLTPISNIRNSPYHATVRALAAIWDMECTPQTGLRFLSFISLMQPEMKCLLVQKDSRALVLLAYWYTKIFHLHWWWHQRAVIECAAICIYLKKFYSSDPLIMTMLQYPLSRLDELRAGSFTSEPMTYGDGCKAEPGIA